MLNGWHKQHSLSRVKIAKIFSPIFSGKKKYFTAEKTRNSRPTFHGKFTAAENIAGTFFQVHFGPAASLVWTDLFWSSSSNWLLQRASE
jgi:hypothetical protein